MTTPVDATAVIVGARLLQPDDGTLVRTVTSVHSLRVGVRATATLITVLAQVALTRVGVEPSAWQDCALESLTPAGGEWVLRCGIGPLAAGQWMVYLRYRGQVTLAGVLDVEA